MTAKRTVALTVLTMPTPAIAEGRPVSPLYWSVLGSSATLKQGAGHIRAIKDPDPVWDPRTSGWSTPPPAVSHPFAARWTVADLPDPTHFAGNFYWLGNATASDGTANIQSACRAWTPNASTPHAPAWHSFFPFKPSVRAHDSYLPNGDIVHHPRGVHFNSHFIEHMWADFGRTRRQPFTWVIAAMVLSYPDRPHTQHLLDAGRNPDAVHFPRLSATAVNTPRRIHDGLGYRTSLSVGPAVVNLSAHVEPGGSAILRARADSARRPKMFFGIFNGTASYTGAFDTGAKRIRRGHTSNGSAQLHRYYVLGRMQNHIDQERATDMLVFEIRFWDKALTGDDLTSQYDQLSSTYHFDRYRAMR